MNEWMDYLEELEYAHDDDMQVANDYANKYREVEEDE